MFRCFVFLVFTLQIVLASQERKILFLGDSLTDGYGIPKNKAFPHLIQLQINEIGKNNESFRGIEVINGGISGSTSASAMTRLRWHLKSKPFLLFLALGANDGLRGLDLDEMEKNLRNTIQLARDSKVKVILAGMRIPPNYGKKYTEKFEKIYPKLSKEFQIPLMPFLLKDVAAVKKYNQSDQIHPNEQGHAVIAKNVFPYLEKVILGK